MGIRYKGIKYIQEIFHVTKCTDFSKLRLVQIGDLFIRGDAHAFGIRHGKAFNYFRDLGFEVKTIDLGIGQERIGPEVLQYDLSKPIVEEIGEFDFVIDFGTSEHIENQYELFKNIHKLCKINGVMIHSNPSPNYGSDHGLYHYTPSFYTQLARICHYKIIDVREMTTDYWAKDPPRKSHLHAALVRARGEFPSERRFGDAMKYLKVILGRERRTLERTKKEQLEKKKLEQEKGK